MFRSAPVDFLVPLYVKEKKSRHKVLLHTESVGRSVGGVERPDNRSGHFRLKISGAGRTDLFLLNGVGNEYSFFPLVRNLNDLN